MLVINGLSKTYKGGKKAVDDLSLHVKPGCIFGFIGPNGAGKTTTIKCATGLLRFDRGEILIGGRSIKDDPIGCKKQFAYIPDNPDLYLNMTGIKYLNFIADIYEVSEADREERIKLYGEKLGIYSELSGAVGSFSHGMKQKLALVSALLHNPRLIILDEPFVGLDPVASHNLKQILKEKCADGCSVFFSTHVLEVAQQLCDEVAIINGGKIAAMGKTEDVMGDKTLEQIFLELVEK